MAKRTRKKAAKKRAAPPKRKRSSKSKGPTLVVTRGMAVAGKGWIWAARIGTQPLGHVLAKNQGKAKRLARLMAGRLIMRGH